MPTYRTQRNRVNPSHPEAAGICDRCGFLYSHADLAWQFTYGGVGLINTNLLVCPRCLDEPNPQRQAKILPPDPEPVLNARPPSWAQQEASSPFTSAFGPQFGYGTSTPAPVVAVPSGPGTAIPGDD